MIAYFDMSAFIKLLIQEPGSAAAGAVWDAADRRASSRLLYPETRAALAAAVRMGRLDSGQLRTVKELLERLWREVDRIEVAPELARRAGDLAETCSLRGYDSVHLASAEALADPETVLITADRELGAAAQSHGLATTRLSA